jgi:hypothetical protein
MNQALYANMNDKRKRKKKKKEMRHTCLSQKIRTKPVDGSSMDGNSDFCFGGLLMAMDYGI